ncbi:uncharacterized protein Bfra_005336 [Botrytis fragariae]|uniref:Uncharacterized protein n=1 Tax=Botrytis fragariae TaxID=1964551 RepID=A0A8H6EIU9_9HELO|nr:uncharacterized protein Bfra_005336 [Botrytis fragariae]KAF5873869.1 hypothetical protein Bfra_005336 [Botrytis fragariae]
MVRTNSFKVESRESCSQMYEHFLSAFLVEVSFPGKMSHDLRFCKSWIGSHAEIRSDLEPASQASMGASQSAHSNKGAEALELLTITTGGHEIQFFAPLTPHHLGIFMRNIAFIYPMKFRPDKERERSDRSRNYRLSNQQLSNHGQCMAFLRFSISTKGSKHRAEHERLET